MTLVEVSVVDFIDQLGSSNPTPGGGSVAALCGALGSALCTMVSGLTLGREKFKDSWQDIAEVKEAAAKLNSRFLSLTQEDSAAYEAVLAALRLPRETDKQKSSRRAAMQKAMKKAARVPLETLRSAEQLLGLAGVAVQQGNPNTLTDAAAAVQAARTAAAVASYNVMVNLPGIKDETFVAQSKKEVEEILERVNVLFHKTEDHVRALLS